MLNNNIIIILVMAIGIGIIDISIGAALRSLSKTTSTGIADAIAGWGTFVILVISAAGAFLFVVFIADLLLGIFRTG